MRCVLGNRHFPPISQPENSSDMLPPRHAKTANGIFFNLLFMLCQRAAQYALRKALSACMSFGNVHDFGSGTIEIWACVL